MKKIRRPSITYLSWWTDDYCFRLIYLILGIMLYCILFPTLSLIDSIICSLYFAAILDTIYVLAAIFISSAYKEYKDKKT